MRLNTLFPYGILRDERIGPNPITAQTLIKRLIDPVVPENRAMASLPIRTAPRLDCTLTPTTPPESGQTRQAAKIGFNWGEVFKGLSPKSESSKSLDAVEVQKVAEIGLTENNTDLTKVPDSSLQSPDKIPPVKKLGRPRKFDPAVIKVSYDKFKSEKPNGTDEQFYSEQGMTEREWYRLKKLIREI